MIKKVITLAIFALVCCCATGFAQSASFEKERHKQMLRLIKDEVKKNYFDPALKGIDIEANYKAAVEKINKSTSIGQINGIIAQFLMDFDDSHLFFVPPGKVNKSDFGFDFRMIGDKPFVTRVKKKSDAETKGLQIGDEIYSINDFEPSRENLWKMRYYYFFLRPQPTMKLEVTKPDGKEVQYVIEPKITPGKQLLDLTHSFQDFSDLIRDSEHAALDESRQYFVDNLQNAFIWKMPGFSLEPSKVDDIIGRAKKHPAIIFDLRGNGGGRVDMVLRLIGNVFDRNIKVGDEKKRKSTKEIIAKTRGKDVYAGKIVVLIDSASGSASEVFSRVIQLEKRGVVIGDRSAGAVMESLFYQYEAGVDIVVFFGASVTIADLIMTDGKSLEKIGVTPDIALIPTAADIAGKRDVVMSKALQTLGVEMTPEAAAKLFPESRDDQ